MRYWINVRPFSHRGPGWSQSWRIGSRQPVFERWEAPQCGGLWLDTGPVSAADLCSSGTASPRWAIVAWPAANTGECQTWQNLGIWAGLWTDSTGCMDAAWEAKTTSASIQSIDKDTVLHQLQRKVWEITLRFTIKWGYYKEDPSVFQVCYLFRFADSVERQRHHVGTVENIFVATAAGHRGDFASVEADSHLVGDFWLWGRGGLSYCPTEMKACNDSRQEKESLVTLLFLAILTPPKYTNSSRPTLLFSWKRNTKGWRVEWWNRVSTEGKQD